MAKKRTKKSKTLQIRQESDRDLLAKLYYVAKLERRTATSMARVILDDSLTEYLKEHNIDLDESQLAAAG